MENKNCGKELDKGRRLVRRSVNRQATRTRRLGPFNRPGDLLAGAVFLGAALSTSFADKTVGFGYSFATETGAVLPEDPVAQDLFAPFP
jgi:hypothetical protein